MADLPVNITEPGEENITEYALNHTSLIDFLASIRGLKVLAEQFLRQSINEELPYSYRVWAQGWYPIICALSSTSEVLLMQQILNDPPAGR